MTKKVKLNNAQLSEEEKKNKLALMVRLGEPLAQEITGKLSQYGCTTEGLMAETYAVAKAYGSLKAAALSEGWDCQSLFDKLVPMFFEETLELLAELEKEENEK